MKLSRPIRDARAPRGYPVAHRRPTQQSGRLTEPPSEGRRRSIGTPGTCGTRDGACARSMLTVRSSTLEQSSVSIAAVNRRIMSPRARAQGRGGLLLNRSRPLAFGLLAPERGVRGDA